VVIFISIIIPVSLLFILLFLGLAFAGLDTALPVPSQVRSSRPQEDQDWPQGASPVIGLSHFWGLHSLGTPMGHAWSQPECITEPLGLYHPDPSPGCLLCWGLAPCTSVSRAVASGPSILCPDQGFENLFPALTGLWLMGWTSTGPHKPLPPPGCLTLVLCPQWPWLHLPLLFWIPLGLYHPRLDHPGLRRIWTAPEGFCHPWG
jgi:hypothetical protein